MEVVIFDTLQFFKTEPLSMLDFLHIYSSFYLLIYYTQQQHLVLTSI